MRIAISKRHSRRRGAAMVYVVVAMGLLMGLTSLAVDLGRYQAVHNEMYGAAVAAARAGAYSMANTGATSTTCTSAANAVVTANKADNAAISNNNVTVTFGIWTSATSTFASSAFSAANACQVQISYTVPLTFGKIIGYASKSAVESSVAMITIQTATPYVYANGDPWLAGEPNGTTASQPDPNYVSLAANQDHPFPNDIAGPNGSQYIGGSNGSSYGSLGASGTYVPAYTSGHGSNRVSVPAQPYSSPVAVAVNIKPGSTIRISNVSGTASNDAGTAPWESANGNGGTTGVYDNAAANGVSEHGMSDAYMPIGSMNAVFLNNNLPDNQTVPPVLDFSTQAARDYNSIAPQLQQVFYVGTGQTSGSTQQEISVPAGATRLFLGFMDGWEWSNNLGGYNATITEITVQTVQ